MVLVPGRRLDLKGKTLIGFVSKPSRDAARRPERQRDQDMMSGTGDSAAETKSGLGFLDWVRQLFKRRIVCVECGQPVEEPFDLKAAQRAASKHMAENPGHKIDVREPLPLCEGCQSVWDEACKDILGPIGVTKTSELIVHDIGPDGASTYQLVIGRDIDPELAEQLIASNGGNHVYTIHVYEAGERLVNFVNKDAYLLMKEAIADIPPVPTAEENVAALNEMIASAKARKGNTDS